MIRKEAGFFIGLCFKKAPPTVPLIEFSVFTSTHDFWSMQQRMGSNVGISPTMIRILMMRFAGLHNLHRMRVTSKQRAPQIPGRYTLITIVGFLDIMYLAICKSIND